MKTKTNNTKRPMNPKQTAIFLLNNKTWSMQQEQVNEEAYKMYVDARAKSFDAFKHEAKAEAFCVEVCKQYKNILACRKNTK